MADHQQYPLTGNQLAAAISDAIVRLHRQYYGKGPSEAKTYLVGDFCFCVLKEPFTTVEQTLIEVGKQQSVRDVRQSFQDAMTIKFKQAVEDLAGLEVIAFMSQTHVGPDLAVEAFQFQNNSSSSQQPS